MKVKKGDTVKVLSGKDRGHLGEIVRIFPRRMLVLVKGANIVTRHQKARGEKQAGGRIKVELPIHISNVQVINPDTGLPARIGYDTKGKEKIRIFRGGGAKKVQKE